MPTLSSVPEEKKLSLADHYNCEAMKIASMPGGGTTIGEVHDAIEKHVNQQIKGVLDEALANSVFKNKHEAEEHVVDYENGYNDGVEAAEDVIKEIRERYKT